jgi:hypothetical protein
VKRLLVASVIALVIVGGLGIYSLRVLGDAARRAGELDKAFDAAAKALLETDGLFPSAATPRLTPSVPDVAEVREWPGRRRACGTSSGDFHTKETVNQLLGCLRRAISGR